MSISIGTWLNDGAISRLLPEQPCLLCGAYSSQGVCCVGCEAELPRLPAARCPICALPTLNGAPCGRCLKKRPFFDRTIAEFAYSFPVDRLIQAFKFDERLLVANFLADSLHPNVERLPDALIPMPLHPARLRERGHNQSLGLARALGRRLGTSVWPDVVQRQRDTPPQASLAWKERQRNLRGAFLALPKVEGRHLAIVDDVMTTGASLNELARALKQAGAREVEAWVVARTLPYSR